MGQFQQTLKKTLRSPLHPPRPTGVLPWEGPGGGRAPAGFSPLDLSPDLWLRSDLGVTTSGSDVTAWADQSGNANNYSTSGNEPTFIASHANLNGHPGVQFVAANSDHMDGSVTGYVGDRTVFAVYDWETQSNNDYLFNINAQLFLVCSTNAADFRMGYWDGGWRAANASTATTGGQYVTWHLVGPSSGEVRKNGATVAGGSGLSYTDNTASSTTATLGYTTANAPNAVVAEFITYNKSLTAGEIAQVESYLATRYAL